MHRHTIEMRMRHDRSVTEKPLDGTGNSLIDRRPRDRALVDAMGGDVYGIKVILRIDKRVPFR